MTATKPRVFAAVTAGHFAIDVFNSMGPVLLAWLQAQMNLSTAQVGLGVGLYQLLAGSTQPLFGYIVDIVGSRIIGPLSVFSTHVFVCLGIALGVSTGNFWFFLIPFSLAAIGSGAFHPQGTMHAGSPTSGQAATTTAIFFFFGQMGLAAGPPLGGLALDRFGPQGIYGLALLLAPVPLLMVVAMGSRAHNPSPKKEPKPRVNEAEHRALASAAMEVVKLQETPHSPRPESQRDEPRRPESSRPESIKTSEGSQLTVLLLAVVFSCRAWIFIGTAGFLPLLFQQRGWTSTRQGVLSGLFWLGGGFAGVIAGVIADRFGRRATVAISTFCGALLLLALPQAQDTVALGLALVTGALLGAPHSILMVMAQTLLPVRKGLASGIALGFLFAMGALASWGIGLLAGWYELAVVLQGGAIVGVLAALFSLFLPASRAVARPTVA